MSSIWRQVVICIILYWIWCQVSADGEKLDNSVNLTWHESHKYCKDNGKVLFDAKKNEYEASLRNILKDTNQAWVSARVEFSPFVKVPVCMEAKKQFAPNTSFDTDIIGNCLKFCNTQLYAGLKDKDCYCFEDASNLAWSMKCNSTCKTDPFHQCGGISLYEKVDKLITQRIQHGCKECFYARTTSGDNDLFTDSCVGYMADGAMCENGNLTACRYYNWTVASGTICRMDQTGSLSWKQAKQSCADIGGYLMSSGISTSKIKTNSTYWFGFFRIPMIHTMNALEVDMNDTCCAVARRVGDLVLIEGDDCHAKHAIICQDEGLGRSSASPQSTDESISSELSSSEPTDRKIIYGVVAVSAMLLVALVITALVCISRRGQVSQERANLSATDSTTEQHALLVKQISIPPSKPSRKVRTLNKNLQSSYENVAFVPGRQEVAIQQSDYSNFEYDKINFDKAHIQETDYKDGDTHVYDHGSLQRTEEQYDVMNMSGVMTPIMDETYDRTTL